MNSFFYILKTKSFFAILEITKNDLERPTIGSKDFKILFIKGDIKYEALERLMNTINISPKDVAMTKNELIKMIFLKL